MMNHTPNSPRERDGGGRKVDEPVQCAACLQAWPCEVSTLQAEVQQLRRALDAVEATLDPSTLKKVTKAIREAPRRARA